MNDENLTARGKRMGRPPGTMIEHKAMKDKKQLLDTAQLIDDINAEVISLQAAYAGDKEISSARVGASKAIFKVKMELLGKVLPTLSLVKTTGEIDVHHTGRVHHEVSNSELAMRFRLWKSQNEHLLDHPATPVPPRPPAPILVDGVVVNRAEIDEAVKLQAAYLKSEADIIEGNSKVIKVEPDTYDWL